MKKINIFILFTFTVYNLNAQNESINGTLTVKDQVKLNNTTNNQILQIRPNSGYSGYIYWAENSIAERGILGFQAGSGDLVYRSGGTSFLSGIERFRVKSNGNFGIGTTNPGAILEVSGVHNQVKIDAIGSGNDAEILFDTRLDNGNNYNTAKIIADGGTGGTTPSLNFNVIDGDGSGWDQTLTIRSTDGSDNSGNVGIGTSIPNSKLEIFSGGIETNAYNANAFVLRGTHSSSSNDKRMLGMTISLDDASNVHSSSQKSVGLFAQSSGSWSNNVDMVFYTRGSNQAPYFS